MPGISSTFYESIKRFGRISSHVSIPAYPNIVSYTVKYTIAAGTLFIRCGVSPPYNLEIPSSLTTVTKTRNNPSYLRFCSPTIDGACLNRVLATYTQSSEKEDGNLMWISYNCGKKFSKEAGSQCICQFLAVCGRCLIFRTEYSLETLEHDPLYRSLADTQVAGAESSEKSFRPFMSPYLNHTI